MKLIVCDGGETFELHVPPLQLPLVILLEQQRSNEPDYRRIVWEDADDIGASLDFRVQTLEWIG